jgi:tetratricopeptide (TPR) repeat protein
MPAPLFRIGTAHALAALLASIALAQPARAQTLALSSVDNSGLDAQLMYQLLIGEMELRAGEAGTAYEVMLDAARRTKDEQLFRRATDIALEARAGDQALAAVKAWRTALPASLEALRFHVQLLVALNRTPEALEPLKALVAQTPLPMRAATIGSLPRFFGRVAEPKQAAALLEQALAPYIDTADTAIAARVALGRTWLGAQDSSKALEQAQRAHRRDPAADGPALLAVDLLPATPAAEPIVLAHLKAKPDSHGVRLSYVRVLTSSQRYAEAIDQLDTVTRIAPTLTPPWLTLGALQLELRHPAEATVALQKFVQLAQASGVATTAPVKPVADAGSEAPDDEEDTPASAANEALTQAWLLLAQAAEQQGDYKGAEAWLAKVENPQRLLEVQSRRASVLARQGKVKEARELIRQVPEKTADDARAKMLAEAQVLRDAKQWSEAGVVLAAANQRFPDDVDLLYEESMAAEKLNHLDDMERLLRKVIALKPDHHHAYNALGYSLAERNVRLPEAKTLIQKALALSPGEPFITDSLGWVEYRLGNRDEALRLLRGAYQSRPDPEIGAHLGEVLWVAGQRDEARRVLREARSRDAANDVLQEMLKRLRVDL